MFRLCTRYSGRGKGEKKKKKKGKVGDKGIEKKNLD